MALPTKKTALMTALIASLLASAGGAAFLHKHHNPTLREVYAACEKGEIEGVVCCEDVLRVSDWSRMLKQCGLVTPGKPDPFGVRNKQEDEWDKTQAEQLGAMK